MVLTLKRWESRSSPGIAASEARYETHSQVKGLTHKGGPFGVFRGVNTHGAAGWSSPVARQAHNLKVVGSNPTPATSITLKTHYKKASLFPAGPFAFELETDPQ